MIAIAPVRANMRGVDRRIIRFIWCWSRACLRADTIGENTSAPRCAMRLRDVPRRPRTRRRACGWASMRRRRHALRLRSDECRKVCPMGVRYAEYRDIDIDEFDAVVVGSGFAGSVTARELAEKGGMRVLIIEKRAHIAGSANF